MAGDKITASVQYYYQGTAGGNNTNFPEAVLGSMLQAISGGNAASSVVKANTSAINTNLGGLPGFINAVQPNGSDPTEATPQAFLTILFFDERFNFIDAADGGLVQSRVASSVGADGSSMAHNSIPAPKNGYAYVYVSNQSNLDVFFDNLKVQIVTGNIVEENHYYSYGLKIAAISSKKLGVSYEGMLKNSYLYNDKELFEDGDLNWYDYGFRNYDPQIGRFTQLDPLTYDYPFYTPYQYAGCEPIANVDVDGLEPEPVVKAITGFATQGVSNISAHVAAAGINAGKWVVAGFKNGAAVSKVIHNTGQLFQQLVLACEILGIATKTLSVTERAIQLSRPTGDLGSNFGVPNQSELAKSYYHQTLDLIKHDWHPIDVSMRSFYGLPEGGKINWTTGEIRANETSIEMTEDPITLLGPGLIRGMTAKLASGIGFAAKTGGKELYNFGKSAAQHMTEPGRKVPLQILDDVIKNTKGLPDPEGSGALMHYSPMWRNGKLYNLEVLYDKASNSIWHFEYSPIKP